MLKVYANLLGEWIDITNSGTVEDHKDPVAYLKDMLVFHVDSSDPQCFKYGYINVQYGGKNYRIHPSAIQVVTE